MIHLVLIFFQTTVISDLYVLQNKFHRDGFFLIAPDVKYYRLAISMFIVSFRSCHYIFKCISSSGINHQTHLK